MLPVLAAIRRCAVCCAAAMNNSISPSLCRILALTLACAVSAGIAAEKESIDSLTARVMGRWYPFLMSMHLTHFSSWTTSILCEKAGLRQVSVTPHLRFLRAGYVAKKMEQVMPRLGGAVHRMVRAVGMEDRHIVISGLGLFNAFAVKK